jgi:hypothetical protein
MEEATLPTDENGELDGPHVLTDVSQQGFTISESIMVCGMRLDTDVDDVKPSDFNSPQSEKSYCQGGKQAHNEQQQGLNYWFTW